MMIAKKGIQRVQRRNKPDSRFQGVCRLVADKKLILRKIKSITKGNVKLSGLYEFREEHYEGWVTGKDS